MAEPKRMRILHIEDDVLDAELIRRALYLTGVDYDIHLATSGKRCLEALETGSFDLVLSDSHGYDFTGLEILHLVRKHLPLVPFIFLSGSFDDTDTKMLKTEGATDCILKGDLDTLVPAIQRVLLYRK